MLHLNANVFLIPSESFVLRNADIKSIFLKGGLHGDFLDNLFNQFIYICMYILYVHVIKQETINNLY